MEIITQKKEKLTELYRAKNKIFKDDWLDTTIKLTDGISLENFIYAIDCAIITKAFRFDDIIPFIKEKATERRLKEHDIIKHEEPFARSPQSHKRCYALITRSLKFKKWPEGMTYKIFHEAVANKWNLCRNEEQRIAVIGESENMFDEIYKACEPDAKQETPVTAPVSTAPARAESQKERPDPF